MSPTQNGITVREKTTECTLRRKQQDFAKDTAKMVAQDDEIRTKTKQMICLLELSK